METRCTNDGSNNTRRHAHKNCLSTESVLLGEEDQQGGATGGIGVKNIDYSHKKKNLIVI